MIDKDELRKRIDYNFNMISERTHSLMNTDLIILTFILIILVGGFVMHDRQQDEIDSIRKELIETKKDVIRVKNDTQQ